MSSDVEHAAQATSLAALLDACVADRILSRDQASQILARAARETVVPSGAPPRPGTGLALEALGYVGGVVVLVSAILIANLYWSDLTIETRIAIVGAAAAVLLAGGFAVPRRLGHVGRRLRSVLWLTATAAFTGFVGMAGTELIELSGDDAALLTTSGAAVLAVALWSVHRHLVQQVVAAVALMATVTAVLAKIEAPDAVPALGAWAVAGVWFLLGWTGRLTPRRVVLDLAAAAAIAVSLMTLPVDWGYALAIGTVAAVVVIAVVRADLVLLGIGSVGTLIVIPLAVGEWFPDSSAVPFVLLGAGLALVGVAVWTARRRSGRAAHANSR